MRVLITALLSLCLMTTASATKTFPIKRWSTPNGATVVFYKAREVPILDIIVAFKAGSAYDGKQYGLSALTTRMIDQGNNGIDANTIAEKLADTGAQFNSESNRDMIALSLRTLTKPKALQHATDVFSLIINAPDFQESTLVREKNQQLMAIKQMHESPDDIANRAFFKTLYGDHPYAHPVNGDADHVSALTKTDVKRFYQQHFSASNAFIVMVGALSDDEATKLAEKLSRPLPEGRPVKAIPKPQPLKEEINIEIPFPSSQTAIRIGQLGIDHHHPDYFALKVGNYILGGGGLVSRLSEQLREKRGLTYSVTSQFLPLPGQGPFVIGLATRAQQALEAENVTRETLANFVKNGPTAKELLAAKQYLTGSFPLSLASNRNIAQMLLKISFYDLPVNYLEHYVACIEKVSLDDIKHAFERTLSPHKLLQVSVGKQ